MSLGEHQQRLIAAQHAMQSGVAAKMQIDPAETDPKHMRVGVNSALSGLGALAKLLIDKGVLTEDEYFAATADAMERVGSDAGGDGGPCAGVAHCPARIAAAAAR